MTDDKTVRVAELTGEYAAAMRLAYEHLMDTEKEMGPEQASSMACTALISARDTLHPRQSNRGGGGSGGSGGKMDWDAWRKVPVDEREYTGGFWDNPPEEEGGMGSMKRLRWVNRTLLEHFTKTNKDPDVAMGARFKFFNGWFEAKFGRPLSPNYAEKDSALTKGESSYLMDKAEGKFPELFPKKKEGEA